MEQQHTQDEWEDLEGKILAAELRGLRNAAGLSQEEMSARCRCHRNTIVSMETNAKNAKMRYILQYRKLALTALDNTSVAEFKHDLADSVSIKLGKRLRRIFGA